MVSHIRCVNSVRANSASNRASVSSIKCHFLSIPLSLVCNDNDATRPLRALCTQCPTVMSRPPQQDLYHVIGFQSLYPEREAL